LKELRTPIAVFLLIIFGAGFSISFKSPLVTYTGNNTKSSFSKASIKTDTTKPRSILLDSTYYSGYLGNLEPVKGQILDAKHIERVLKAPVPIYHPLTNKEKRGYTLKIDESAIKRPHDTVIFKKKCLVTYISLKFVNSLDDTLKYMSMDCSWLDCFFTNNSHIGFGKQLCYKNGPIVKSIAPHGSENIYIPIVVNKGLNFHNQKFRIGISLQKFIDRKQSTEFNLFTLLLRPETSNLIWSNEVEIR
jgi:hypothetical protein